MPEWFEDEEFWTATYPFMFPDERLALGEEQVEKLLRLAKLRLKPTSHSAEGR
jgi:hypothetical protein